MKKRNFIARERVVNPADSGSGFPNTKFNSKRKALYILLTLALLVGGLQGLFLSLSNTTVSNPIGSAAQVTRPIVVNNQLNVKLPTNKTEAGLFAGQYASPFNFEELTKMRREYASKVGLNPANIESFNPPGLGSKPREGAAPTPTPPNNANLPKRATNDPNYIFNPVGCNAIPGGSTYFEPNDTPPSATALVAAVSQLHDLRTIGSDPVGTLPTDGDIDWLRFTVGSGLIQTVQILSLGDSDMVPVVELWRGTATTADTLIESFEYSSNRTSVSYTTQPGDDASGVYFYVRIYGALNLSCTGTYRVVLTTTAASTPTPTVTTTPDPCRDPYEDDGQPSRAKELRVTYTTTPPFGGTPGAPVSSTVNANAQTRYICPLGDQDWVYIDLVKGKPYSISTANLTGGLDTIITLFEQDGAGNLNPIFANDDYYGMDLASRIDFVVPADETTATGEFVRYYVNIKDVSNKGTRNLSYLLTLTSPGTGKTTSNNCIDYYESDGLPHLSKEILVRETQSRVLCPNGDADWIKFFAKAGRSYQLTINFNETIAGLDTYLYVFSLLFDPADLTVVVSQRMIADSQSQTAATDPKARVSFSVPVDGIFYAQVKNNGDIGREGFNYTISYALAGVAAPPATTAAPTTVAPTKTPTATTTAAATTAAIDETELTSQKSQAFADPAFQQLWSYNDLAVAQNQTQRSWEWGPKPGVTAFEAYAESPGGQRQVQYFDKSRMEINDPKVERGSSWFVSNGLLVREMVTGQLAKGDKAIEQRVPAGIPVAGDITVDNLAPTYARFASLITNGENNRAANLVGQTVKTGLARDGSVWTVSTPPENVKIAAYISETGHNVPQVFYDYMLSKGTIYERGFKQGQLRDWVFAMGYPLAEPYWIKAKVGGVEKDILVQVFERRVLTYTPSNAAEWRIEMANVGQHYYLWRYSKNLHDQ